MLKNAIPAMIAMLMVLVYNLADTFFIGQTHDDLQVAAVSMCTPVFLLFMSVGTVFGVGGVSVISRALGEGRTDYAKYGYFEPGDGLCAHHDALSHPGRRAEIHCAADVSGPDPVRTGKRKEFCEMDEITMPSREEMEKLLEKAQQDYQAAMEKLTPEERAQAEERAKKLIEEDQAAMQKMLDEAAKVAAGIGTKAAPKFCTNCGAPAGDGKFCTNCGSPLKPFV